VEIGVDSNTDELTVHNRFEEAVAVEADVEAFQKGSDRP
jgi:hypothetical protein